MNACDLYFSGKFSYIKTLMLLLLFFSPETLIMRQIYINSYIAVHEIDMPWPSCYKLRLLQITSLHILLLNYCLVIIFMRSTTAKLLCRLARDLWYQKALWSLFQTEEASLRPVTVSCWNSGHRDTAPEAVLKRQTGSDRGSSCVLQPPVRLIFLLYSVWQIMYLIQWVN